MGKNKRKMPSKDLRALVRGFFDENPEYIEQIEDGFVFTKGLRDALQPFGDMDVTERFRSTEFLRALFTYDNAMSNEEFDKILSSCLEKDEECHGD